MSEEQNHEVQRGIDLVSSVLTVGNLFFGYIAILAAARGTVFDLDSAAKFIGWAILFDGLDGRVARLRKVASPFGKELDSLADVISFGIAPAFLALVWGLRGIQTGGDPAWARHIYEIGWVICFAFAFCGAWRLARFNVLPTPTHANPATHSHRYFVGMPIPAGAGVVAAIVHFAPTPITDWEWAVAWAGLVALLALLMVSPIRYPSFKRLSLGGRGRSIIGLAVLVALIWFFSRPVLLALAITYLLSGLLTEARRRLTGHVE
ncbi:MAG TPA: CDP-diacylglycerol--serine O-phosphatidyltransferase [Candidatus Xenobia bacterium]|nr:CDP-diacylglycerol--serine O-phosphatidyltransferase [Candidatus Xenobia bacterium]